jgi:hypothetical protein
MKGKELNPDDIYTIERDKLLSEEFNGKVMVLFFAMIIGIIGTIIIERQLQKSNRVESRVPVRSDDNQTFHRSKDYRR